MKNFVKMTLATLTGLLIFGFVASFLFFGIIGVMTTLGEKQPIMPAKAVLTLDLSTVTLDEQTSEPDPMAMIQGAETPSPVGIFSIVQAIRKAAQDPAVSFIYMKPDGVTGGFAHIEELRKALEDFRQSGKAIVSYTESPNNPSYYLASVSDKIFMTCHEGGMNMLTGISSQMIFLKDILDEVGINVQLIRHGKYKSAGEMFVRSSSSKENMEQNKAMISSIWNSWAEKIAESRGITTDSLNDMLNNLELNFPSDFLEKGLVDELITRDELEQKLTALFVAEKSEDVKSISIQDYAALQKNFSLNSKGKVAVVYANGEIIDGDDKKNVAGDRFAEIISKIRKDSTIKAVVLRVNSPGGSVLASEKIKAEIALLQKRMPVVASYGDYAASGGYWISAGCDKIFSNGTTLTGSIGVFSMIPDFGKAIKDKIHVNITQVKSNAHADIYSMMRPLDSKEIAYMQASVENIYDKFTKLVSEGRDMNVERVDEIAQGRVWTGAEALEIGLVDQIGTIQDAITWAALSIDGVSDLGEVTIEEYPKPLTSIEVLLESLGMGEQSIFAGTPFENIISAFSNMSRKDYGKVFARMPYEITLQ